ncbi:MAG TPA: NAD(P)-binding protein, partial [Actinoplanes sp.]|nr:NAD(P)-binding protein [Actinoplanes sp.]
MIGAGMAGLVAARVLSRRYASVAVLDRDTP